VTLELRWRDGELVSTMSVREHHPLVAVQKRRTQRIDVVVSFVVQRASGHRILGRG